MANKKQNKYDLRHKRNIKAYQLQMDAIYRSAIREAVAISGTVGEIKPDTLFSFDDYPITRKRIETLLSGLKSRIETVVLNGIEAEWTLANNKNNELANRVFGNNVGKLSEAQYRRYYSTNEAAREAFTQRKINGLNLSDSVWKYTNQFKEEIELGLDVGIRSGRSADELSRDLRSYLKQPDKLFRRVRDEHGQLQLSKRAAAYHPGRGVYRSSYKNARRLAATETNIAYRTADHLRWQSMGFVVGIEIHLSGNHPFPDICDELKGSYPKDFKFTGWHPQCRCYATSILKTEAELDADTQKILNGEPVDEESANTVKDVPQAFKDWLKQNESRIKTAHSMPYFLQDNGTIKDGKFTLKEFGKIANTATKTSMQMEEVIDEFALRRNLMKLWDARMDGYLNLEVDLDSISDDIDLGELRKAQSRISSLLTSVERHKSRTAGDIRRIQDLADERKYGKAYVENVHKIEKSLGIQHGKRMTHEEANMGKVNPNYGKLGFNTNCSTCSATYVLRTMGFNVQAKANIKGNLHVRSLSEGLTTWDKWKNGMSNYNSTERWMANKGYQSMDAQRYMEFINEYTQTAGIYEFNVGYKGGGGHSTLLRRNKDGTIEMIEQQVTTNGTLADLLPLLSATPGTVRGIFRVDNAVFNAKYADIVELVK